MRATCLELKIVFDPWQDSAGKAILGKSKDRLYAADAVVLSVPRQVGKTFLIGSIVFSLCITQPKTLALWTAHREKTAADTFKDIKSLAERPEAARHVKKIYDSANDKRIVFANGSEFVFGARESGFGRGFKKVGIVVFDEAQILTEKAVDDMVPATNRHPNPLIIYLGTPPKPSDPGQHFAILRHEALDGESDSTLYIEFSADQCRDPSKLAAWVRDRVQWAKANPSYPEHTTARAMMRMLKNLGTASFLREGLGIWDEDATIRPFAPGAWRLVSTRKKPPTPAGLGIAADPEATWLSLGSSSAGKKPYLGSVLRMRVDDQAKFIAEVARIQRKYDCPVVVDAKGPAGFLIPELEKAGVTVTPATSEIFIRASANIRTAVAKGKVQHGDFTELNDAVDAAEWKRVGDRKVLGRKGDIAMLEAVALALWAATEDYDVLDTIY